MALLFCCAAQQVSSSKLDVSPHNLIACCQLHRVARPHLRYIVPFLSAGHRLCRARALIARVCGVGCDDGG
jgi:hypothetical protein